MKIKKQIIKVVALMMCMALLASCSMVFVDEEMDNAQVVAVVNGHEILKSDLLLEFNTYAASYGHAVDDANTGENKAAGDEFKSILWEEYVYDELMNQFMESLGVTLSEENLQDVQDIVDSNTEYYTELATSEAEAEGLTGEELEARIAELTADYLEVGGITNGVLEQVQLRYAKTDALVDYYAQSIEPTEEEMLAWYETELASQIEAMDGFPGGFLNYYPDTALHTPDTYRLVRNLHISIPSDIIIEINNLRNAGDDDAADALRDEELAKIKAEIDAAYERIENGEDFATVCAELTDDSNMQRDEYQELGRPIFETIGGEEEEFVEAAYTLTNVGDYTEPFSADDGYYIVQYSGELPPGDLPYEDAKEICREQVILEQAQTKYTEEFTAFEEAATIEDYKSRLF